MRRNRQCRALSDQRSQTSTPEAACLNQLPGNQARNPEGKFAYSCDKRQGESRIPRDAKKVADEKITAFLHSETSGNREGRRANRQCRALQDDRINKCRVEI